MIVAWAASRVCVLIRCPCAYSYSRQLAAGSATSSAGGTVHGLTAPFERVAVGNGAGGVAHVVAPVPPSPAPPTHTIPPSLRQRSEPRAVPRGARRLSRPPRNICPIAARRMTPARAIWAPIVALVATVNDNVVGHVALHPCSGAGTARTHERSVIAAVQELRILH